MSAENPAPPAEPKQPEPIQSKPAPPAAAKTVASGKSESEIALEIELEAERKRLLAEKERTKKLETDVSHLQDEAKALREIGLKKEPQPTKAKSSWGFFEE